MVADCTTQKPVVWPKVIGTISLVVGTFAILFHTGTIGAVITEGRSPDLYVAEGVKIVRTRWDLAAVRDVILIGVSLCAAFLLVIAGAQLLRRRTSARLLHMAYALIAAAIAIVNTGIFL